MNVQGNQQVNPGLNGKPLSKVIGEVAVLASVKTSTLGMSRVDKRASVESDQAHGATSGASKVNVKRLPGAEDAVDLIKKQHTKARVLVDKYTTQWGDDRHLLPNVYIGDVMGEFDVISRDHNKLVSQFVDNATSYITKAQQNLGSYKIDLPSVREISNAFNLELMLAPVPDISAYTAGNSELEKHMKARFEDDIREAYQGAVKDLMQKLADPLENIVDRMKAYDERQLLKEKDIDVGKTGTFKKTIMSNVQDIAKVFRSFNMVGDPAMEAIAQHLEGFANIEHKDLTGSQELRKAVADKAAEIRGMLGGWLD